MMARQLPFVAEPNGSPAPTRDDGTDPLLCPPGPLIAPGGMAAATPRSPAEYARVQALMEAATYRFAWTMRDTPHWDTLRHTWANDDDVLWAAQAILDHGSRTT